MEQDKRLFKEIKERRTPPILRFYRWKKPALSYGRIQGIDEKTRKQWESKGYTAVERPTGGGIVFHETDLCFSLIWKKDDLGLAWDICQSYFQIHRWLLTALSELGFECDLTKQKSSYKERGWCFENPVFYDLLYREKKIAGGAQWRDRNTALHQGSIQLNLNQESLNIFKEHFKNHFHAGFQC